MIGSFHPSLSILFWSMFIAETSFSKRNPVGDASLVVTEMILGSSDCTELSVGMGRKQDE